jgi:RNA polymerase sigma-70 factor (ECF subfamily)
MPSEARLDQVRLEALFASSERRLGLFLRHMVRDPELADDLLQQTFVTALQTWPQLADVDNPEAWLFRVARNHALQALRRRRRWLRAVQRFATGITEQPNTDDAEALALRDLLIRELSPDDRSLVLLRYVHGYSGQELADVLGVSAAAVRQRLSRATRHLAAVMTAMGYRPNESGSPRERG